MAKGNSGRIVIEIDPSFKDELYTALKKEDLNMKEWFLTSAEEFLKNRSQMNLKLVSDDEKTNSGIGRG